MKNLFLISASLILAAANSALAHDGPHDDEAGYMQISLLTNVRYLSADTAWPGALPVLGASNEDRRGAWYGGSGIEWRQRWTAEIDTQLMAAYDEHEQKVALDHAVLRYQTDAAQLALGRQSPVLAEAGLSAWALPDLWLYTVLGDDHWHEDGLALRYTVGNLTGHAGVFNGQGYPGAESAMWTAGLAWQNGPWFVAGHAAYLSDVNRSLVTDAHSGHSHVGQAVGCGKLTDCLAGKSTLLRARAGWQGEQYWLQSAWSWQQQDGQLDSTLGRVAYQGELNSLALEGGVKLTDSIKLALRHEWMGIAHELAGVNAAQIASKNGIANSDEQPYQTGVRLAWQAHPAHLLALELYQTRRNGESNHLAMLQWQMNLRVY
ncbi:hypothetical protein HA050_11195 [Iodobacter sp. HSC-16F04]|uniref:Porin n=1 Tax=Iodobacter violaceini TaxID=3044271 RepID=A0ABX0KWU1_9NEIS|nr:hypothetical protein [Iodobacter violacea]NHQ86682.1 hypothetical protein [Iodobacter violacea]